MYKKLTVLFLLFLVLVLFVACSQENFEIPSLDGAEEINIGGESVMKYGDATPEKFAAFCADLDKTDFVKVEEHETMGNRFATYRGTDRYVYTYYTANTGKMRVITGPTAELAKLSYKSDAERKYTPYISSIPQPDNGLGLIMRLPDGRFIICDGGYTGDDRVYTALRNLVPEGKIVIAAWFVSHPHTDHYGAFTDFLINHGGDKDIVLERVMLNFAEPDRYIALEVYGDTVEDVRYIQKVMQENVPHVPVLKVHTGQTIDFGDCAVEILYTMEDHMPDDLRNINDSSMAMRVTLGGKTIMILTDTGYYSGPILDAMWGDYLKSDMLQVAHHGQWPSVESIYHKIAAEVAIVPAKLSRYKFDITDQNWEAQTAAILSYAKDLYTACDAPIMIELPYALQNNKDQMVADIQNYIPKPGEPTE